MSDDNQLRDRGASEKSIPEDDLNAKLGVLTRREVEARILIPVINALGDAFGRDEVLAVVRDTIVNIAREQGAALSQQMGGNSLKKFVDSLAYWTQDKALEIEVIEESDDELFLTSPAAAMPSFMKAWEFGKLEPASHAPAILR